MKRRTNFMTKLGVGIAGLAFLMPQSHAQVLLSAGPYLQDFNTLPAAAGNNVWANNVTLPGWYAASQSSVASQTGYTNILTGAGASNAGDIYSFTNAAVPSDRALGSVSSGSRNNIAYGVRLLNDTGVPLTNFTVSYTGEQWRNGGNTSAQPLAFSYRIDATITDSDPVGVAAWTAVPALNFVSPTVGGTTGVALDGNAAANRTVIPGVTLSGFVVFPGQEIFLRWLDINDAGNDHALALEDLTVSWETNLTAVPGAPVIAANPSNVTVGAGGSATFTVSATGTQPFTYECYATNSGLNQLVGTAPSFTTNYLPVAASGYQFYAIVSNSGGSATSTLATVTVTNVIAVVTNIGYLHTLQNANFVLTNTTSLFSVTGIVTTTDNLTSGSTVSFHIQDETGGIDVFYYTANGPFLGAIPNAGDLLRVTAPLAQFNGLLEFSPTNANPTHELTLLSSGNPVPAPLFFDFTTINPAVMESTYEGRLVVVSNVFLAVTNTSGVVVSGQSIYMTNLTGQTFRLINPQPAIEPQGFPVPAFATSVRGVMTQFDNSAVPLDAGYNMYLLRNSDIEAGTPPFGPTPEPLTIQVLGTDVVLSWTQPAFNLQASSEVTGGYTNITGATSPYTYPLSEGKKFFRLQYSLP